MNPLIELHAFGQSFWYDNIRRKFLDDGTLQNLIDHDGLRGLTSNPSIFQKAISASDDYDQQIAELVNHNNTINDIYEALVLADIKAACDLFADLYQETAGGDGFVSLEVSPHLANDSSGTISEARRLFAAVGRPNLMIKVPATKEGIPAVEQLISEGINVNITLMFNMDHYEAVADAYIKGLQKFKAAGGDPRKVGSVASFFVSRVDSAVDNQLEKLNDPAAEALMGQAAVANARLVYQRYKEIFHSDAFGELSASPQRVLWASTSTKNPSYPDTLYIDQLIGPETVNTIPPATVDAFRDHGTVALTLENGIDQAALVFENLEKLGVNVKEITETLQNDGVVSFENAFDDLMKTLETKVAGYQ